MDINDLVEKTPKNDEEIKTEEPKNETPKLEKKKKNKKLFLFINLILISAIIVIGYMIYKELNNFKDLEKVQIEEIAKIDKILKDTPDAKPFSDFPFTVNEPISMLKIESVGLRSVVFEADKNYGVLDRGVAHDPNSKWVNQQDKVVLTGHREFEFMKLEGVKKDDIITMEDNANIYKYKVSKVEYVETDADGVILDPNSTVLTSTAPNETLILYTCYPFKAFSKVEGRFVVYADRIE